MAYHLVFAPLTAVGWVIFAVIATVLTILMWVTTTTPQAGRVIFGGVIVLISLGWFVLSQPVLQRDLDALAASHYNQSAIISLCQLMPQDAAVGRPSISLEKVSGEVGYSCWAKIRVGETKLTVIAIAPDASDGMNNVKSWGEGESLRLKFPLLYRIDLYAYDPTLPRFWDKTLPHWVGDYVPLTAGPMRAAV